MKKGTRLTELDLEKLIRSVIKESNEDMEQGDENIEDVINYINKLFDQLRSLGQLTTRFLNDVDGIDHFFDIIEDSDLDEDKKDELFGDLEFLHDITDDLFDLENKYFGEY